MDPKELLVIRTILEMFRLAMDREIVEIVEPTADGVILNVGAGNKWIRGAIPLDWPQWDADTMPIPYLDESVRAIHCYHFLEHCTHPIQVLREFQRVLKPGGVVYLCVPYYTSQMSAQDLDHKHVFCEETWRTLFQNPYYDKSKISWKFRIGLNVIIGIVGRNLALLTQLIKES